MYIPLPDDVEKLIARKVKAGEYETPSDLLIHAVHLLDEHDRVRQQRLEDLRREVAIGIERGETKPSPGRPSSASQWRDASVWQRRPSASEPRPTG